MCQQCNWPEFVAEADELLEDLECRIRNDEPPAGLPPVGRTREMIAWVEDHEHASRKLWRELRRHQAKADQCPE